MQCTWKNCEEHGIHEKRNSDGVVWAVLCEAHHKELQDALALSRDDPNKINMKRIMRCWVMASGGADALAKRII